MRGRKITSYSPYDNVGNAYVANVESLIREGGMKSCPPGRCFCIILKCFLRARYSTSIGWKMWIVARNICTIFFSFFFSNYSEGKLFTHSTTDNHMLVAIINGI